MRIEKKRIVAIVHCMILFLTAWLYLYINYYYYRLAYQTSPIFSVIIVCSVMQLFAKKHVNRLCLYLMAVCAVGVSIVCAPKYTVFSAEEKILQSLSEDGNEITFVGCMTVEDGRNGIFQYKNYLFETGDGRTIVFDINSGELYDVEN